MSFSCVFGCFTDSADSVPFEPIPEYIPHDEFENNNKWHMVRINDRTYRIDMESIDQYKKVLSHGGEICYMTVFVISNDVHTHTHNRLTAFDPGLPG